MTSCTFSEFYSACKDRLTDIQLRSLKPEAEYFRMENGYCGLLIEDGRAWISILVGGMPEAWELRRLLNRFPLVGWACRLGSPTYALARYYKAKIEDSGEKYLDGAPVMRCVIDTRQTQRLQKNKVKSQAIT